MARNGISIAAAAACLACLAFLVAPLAHGRVLPASARHHLDNNEAHVMKEYEAFVAKYGPRDYANDAAELEKRLGIFAENLDVIESRNADPDTTFFLEVNEFADMSWEEFQQSRLFEPQADCSATGKPEHMRALRSHEHPHSQDWREKGVVSPVKNQGHCGSCWTFSTTGALEASYAMEFGSMLSLSEQQLVDCAQHFDNAGCSGGLPSHAFEYIRYNGGIDTEIAYPYEAKNGTHCHFKPEAAAVFVHDVVNITEGDEKMLKNAVGVVKPVSVAFEVVSDFRFYKNGTYTSKECRKSPSTVNHAVLAVGYHHDHYWIIKNSWGKEWGMEGYFQMGPIGENMCGVATCSSYPILADPKAQTQSKVQTA
mmetsp:Transcript_3522/g.9169  ORF Transcript_3522/g.9169 Transcript_3522/m.9169 type:complete len:368 (-) Transcript_3522:82-1185(-)